MPTTVAAAIVLLKQIVPSDALPRAATASATTDDATLAIWIADAVRQIQRRRGVTTHAEVTLDLVTDQRIYTLDSAIIGVQEIHPADGAVGGLGSSVFGSPFDVAGYVVPPAGFLPNGQRVTPAIDMLSRQAMHRNHRESTPFRIVAGKLVLDFPTTTGTSVRLVVTKEDGDLTNLPDRHLDLVLTYARMKCHETSLGKTVGLKIQTGDTLAQQNQGAAMDFADRLRLIWTTGLASINPELG